MKSNRLRSRRAAALVSFIALIISTNAALGTEIFPPPGPAGDYYIQFWESQQGPIPNAFPTIDEFTRDIWWYNPLDTRSEYNHFHSYWGGPPNSVPAPTTPTYTIPSVVWVGNVPPQFQTPPANLILPVSMETDEMIRNWLTWYSPHGDTNGSKGAYNSWVSQLSNFQIYAVTQDRYTIAGRAFDSLNGAMYPFAGWNYFEPLPLVPEPSGSTLAALGLSCLAAWLSGRRRLGFPVLYAKPLGQIRPVD